MKLRRKQAAKLLTDILEIVADAHNVETRIATAIERAGLKLPARCPGEAHGNPWIDNCSICAPRWGWVDGKVEIP